jgi:hypothetical protein
MLICEHRLLLNTDEYIILIQHSFCVTKSV